MTAVTGIPPYLMRKFIVRTTVWIVFLAIVLFGAAGTIRWTPGWIYIGFLAVMSIASGSWLARHDPDLFRERLGSFFQKEQKGWDKLRMIPMLVVWLGGLMLMALDGGRYHWSQVPLWLQVVGFILICAGFWLSMLTFKANSYAAPVVKVQKERGHKWSPPGLTPMCVIRCIWVPCFSPQGRRFCSDRGGGLSPLPCLRW